MKKILKLKAVLYEDHQISCRAAFRGANAAETGAVGNVPGVHFCGFSGFFLCSVLYFANENVIINKICLLA